MTILAVSHDMSERWPAGESVTDDKHSSLNPRGSFWEKLNSIFNVIKYAQNYTV